MNYALPISHDANCNAVDMMSCQGGEEISVSNYDTAWSATSSARALSLAWAVNLKTGEMRSDNQATLANGILLVRNLKQGD